MALGPELLLTPDFSNNHADWWSLDGDFSGDICTLHNDEDTLAQFIPPNTNFFEVGKTYRISFDWKWDAATSDDISFSVFDPPTVFINNSDEWTTLSQDFTITQDMFDYVEWGQLVFAVAGISGIWSQVRNPSIRENPGNLFIQTIQMVGAETGEVQTINAGKSDDSTPIYYELETQEIEFGNRAHYKNISDKVTVFAEFGIDSSLEARQDDGNYKPIPISLNNDVNIGQNIDLKGNFFTFKWSGTAKENSPIFSGIYLEKVVDLGITNG